MPLRRTPPYKIHDVIPGTDYRITSIIGSGGMAVVYEVVNEIGATFALKVIYEDIARRAAFDPETMRREASLLVALRKMTEHVVTVIHAGVTPEGLPFYVMERLKGRTLRETIARKQARKQRGEPNASIKLTTVTNALTALSVALAHAHAHVPPILHRDVKPENAFLHCPPGDKAVVKLLDFGLGLLLDATAAVEPQPAVGTLRYMAPEQRARRLLTPAVDIWALGVLAYELLTLHTPWEADGIIAADRETLELALEGPVPHVLDFRPDVPPECAEAVMACLERDPAKRPASALALARAFARVWETLAPTASTVVVLSDGQQATDPGNFPLPAVPTATPPAVEAPVTSQAFSVEPSPPAGINTSQLNAPQRSEVFTTATPSQPFGSTPPPRTVGGAEDDDPSLVMASPLIEPVRPWSVETAPLLTADTLPDPVPLAELLGEHAAVAPVAVEHAPVVVPPPVNEPEHDDVWMESPLEARLPAEQNAERGVRAGTGFLVPSRSIPDSVEPVVRERAATVARPSATVVHRRRATATVVAAAVAAVVSVGAVGRVTLGATGESVVVERRSVISHAAIARFAARVPAPPPPAEREANARTVSTTPAVPTSPLARATRPTISAAKVVSSVSATGVQEPRSDKIDRDYRLNDGVP